MESSFWTRAGSAINGIGAKIVSFNWDTAINSYMQSKFVENAGKAVKTSVDSVFDGLTKKPELTIVILISAGFGTVSVVYLRYQQHIRIPKLPVLTANPEADAFAKEEYQNRMKQYREYVQWSRTVGQAFFAVTAVIVVGAFVIAYDTSQREFKIQMLELQSKEQFAAAQLDAVKVFELMKKVSSSSHRSFAFVYNDTNKAVSVNSYHPWGLGGLAFNKTENIVLKPGEFDIIRSTHTTSFLAGEGIALSDARSGEWHDFGHAEFVMASALANVRKPGWLW